MSLGNQSYCASSSGSCSTGAQVVATEDPEQGRTQGRPRSPSGWPKGGSPVLGREASTAPSTARGPGLSVARKRLPWCLAQRLLATRDPGRDTQPGWEGPLSVLPRSAALWPLGLILSRLRSRPAPGSRWGSSAAPQHEAT